jgi:hypothetical protein
MLEAILAHHPHAHKRAMLEMANARFYSARERLLNINITARL